MYYLPCKVVHFWNSFWIEMSKEYVFFLRLSLPSIIFCIFISFLPLSQLFRSDKWARARGRNIWVSVWNEKWTHGRVAKKRVLFGS